MALPHACSKHCLASKAGRGSTGAVAAKVRASNASLRAELRAVDAVAGKWRAEGSVTFSPGHGAATTVTAWVQPEGSDGFSNGQIRGPSRPGARINTLGAANAVSFTLDLDLRGGAAIMLRLPAIADRTTMRCNHRPLNLVR